MAAADAAEAGETSGAVLEGIAFAEMEQVPAVRPEYAVLAGAARASRIPTLDRPAFLAVAARVGRIRLIDNVWLQPDGTADRGIRLDGSSILYEGGS
jgi:pantothenate synthetase